MVRFVRRWRIAVIYVSFVAVVVWGAWTQDRANAERVETIDRALITCRSIIPAFPSERAPSYD